MSVVVRFLPYSWVFYSDKQHCSNLLSYLKFILNNILPLNFWHLHETIKVEKERDNVDSECKQVFNYRAFL